MPIFGNASMGPDEDEYAVRETNLIQDSIKILKADFADHKGKYLIEAIGSYIAVIYLISISLQHIYKSAGGQKHIYLDPLSVVYVLFQGGVMPVLMALVGGAALFIILIKLTNLYRNDYVYDERRKVYVAKNSGIAGDAKLTEEVKDELEVFYLHNDINDPENVHRIMGLDKYGNYCSVKPIQFTNDNMVVIGSPGSGKSACFVLPHIFQCVRSKTSYIVTDSKGDIYRKSAALAYARGFVVKVINLKPSETWFSDAFNVFTTIRGEMMAETVANIIMDNTSQGKEDQFWRLQGFNLLKALILYVRTAPEYRGKRNLIEVYDILVNNDLTTLQTKLSGITADSPAYGSARIFLSGTPTVQQSAHGGLSVRLNLLGQRAIREMLSHDEIDFRQPLREPCAYYVIISDTDQSNKFIACMFFKTLFNELLDESDQKYAGNPPVHPLIILDEFKATGSIPGFPDILSVARSRKVVIEFILQDLTQIQDMYPTEWHTVMNDCTWWVYINAREEATLKYFSTHTGTQTVKAVSKSYTDSHRKFVHVNPDYRVSESEKERAVLSLTDLENLPNDELVVNVNGKYTVILKKFQYWFHPYNKFIEPRQMEPTGHIPEWRKNLGDDVVLSYIDEVDKNDMEMNEKINAGKQEKTDNLNTDNMDTIEDDGSGDDRVGKPRGLRPLTPRTKSPAEEARKQEQEQRFKDNEKKTSRSMALFDNKN